MKRLLLATMALMLSVSWVLPAQAIPAFARKYSMPCSGCHTAWPQLNATGRTFKLNGYKFSHDNPAHLKKISDFLRFDKHLPLALLIKSRPYEEQANGDRHNQAIHEVELYGAGVLGRDVSGFAELEAEDEDNFSPSWAQAAIDYHFPGSELFNLQVSWGSNTFWDPYDTLNDHRRVTRNHLGPFNLTFGGADNGASRGGQGARLRDSRQNISIFGRALGRLFYGFSFSGDARDTSGLKAKTFTGRLAFDVLPDLMIGGFGLTGTCPADNCNGVERDYSRYGVDLQGDYKNFRLKGVWLTASDDNANGIGSVDNDAWYVEGFYTFHDGNGRPTWMPVIRYDGYETNNGGNQFDELTIGLDYYFTQNVKGFVEYWDQVDVPNGVNDDSRFTLQFEVAF